MRKFRFAGDLLSIPSVKSESGVVQSSLKQRKWLLSAQDSLPPSKVQRGRVGMSGDGSSCRRSRRMKEWDRMASGAGSARSVP